MRYILYSHLKLVWWCARVQSDAERDLVERCVERTRLEAAPYRRVAPAHVNHRPVRPPGPYLPLLGFARFQRPAGRRHIRTALRTSSSSLRPFPARHPYSFLPFFLWVSPSLLLSPSNLVVPDYALYCFPTIIVRVRNAEYHPFICPSVRLCILARNRYKAKMHNHMVCKNCEKTQRLYLTFTLVNESTTKRTKNPRKQYKMSSSIT